MTEQTEKTTETTTEKTTENTVNTNQPAPELQGDQPAENGGTPETGEDSQD